MKLYAAIDLHANNSVQVVLAEKDRIVLEVRQPNDLGLILAQMAPHKKRVRAIAVESTYNWYWLVDGLMEDGYEVKLVNTVGVKTYDGIKYTADEHDARHLAHLLRLGILPTGYIQPKEDRAVRDLLRKRAQLVRFRTTQMLCNQSLASRNTGERISGELVKKSNEGHIQRYSGGDEVKALAMSSNLNTLRCLDEQIAVLEAAVLKRAKLKAEFKRLYRGWDLADPGHDHYV